MIEIESRRCALCKNQVKKYNHARQTFVIGCKGNECVYERKADNKEIWNGSKCGKAFADYKKRTVKREV